MARTLSVLLGVILAREKVDNPWQEYAWRPASVFLNPPDISSWREIKSEDRVSYYHAANLMLELHPKETLGYRANLNEETVSVYVVLRHGTGGGAPGDVNVALVTASAYEAEAYGQGEEETVDAVAMPDALADLLEAFVAEHHVEEKFVKRQRQKHHVEEEYTFGQEPLHTLRQRTSQKAKNSPE